jgi:hypothetical protein
MCFSPDLVATRDVFSVVVGAMVDPIDDSSFWLLRTEETK